MDIITRQEAKAQGLKRYFTGKPCLRGHVSERLVGSKTCCQCTLERQQTQEYKAQKATRGAEYYTANRAEIAAQKADYRQTNRAEIAAQQAAYYADNAEKIAAKRAEYYKLNAERYAAKNATYYKLNAEQIAAYQAEYNKLNAERIAARNADYRQANPHIINAQNAKRRAQKLQATPSWADTAAIKAIYEQASFMSKALGEKQHVDHIYPLISDEVCGLHVATNLQILSASDNLKKSNKLLPMYEMPV